MSGRLVDKDIFRDYDLLLVSPGGAGCTTIHAELDRHKISKNCINDTDGLKHLSSPDQNVYIMNRFLLIIYLYNDPLLSIISHYRRGWHIMQHKKIVIKEELCIEKISTFSKFQTSTLRENKDIFGLESHFYKWANLASDESSNIHFCDFRDKDVVIKLIKEKLNIEINYSLKTRSPKTNEYFDLVHPSVKDIYKRLDAKLKREIIKINSIS